MLASITSRLLCEACVVILDGNVILLLGSRFPEHECCNTFLCSMCA